MTRTQTWKVSLIFGFVLPPLPDSMLLGAQSGGGGFNDKTVNKELIYQA